MGQVKKIVLIALCVITIALSCIVTVFGASGYPMTQVIMNKGNGYSEYTTSSTFRFAIIYNTEDDSFNDGFVDPTSLIIAPIATSQDIAVLLTEMNHNNASQHWVLWQMLATTDVSISYQIQEEGSVHGKATRIVYTPTGEFANELYLQFGWRYRFLFTIKIDGEPWTWAIMGEDFDIGRHAMLENIGGSQLYTFTQSVRFYTRYGSEAFTMNTYVQCTDYADSEFQEVYMTEGMTYEIPLDDTNDDSVNDIYNQGYDDGYGYGYGVGWDNGYDSASIGEYKFHELANIIVSGPITFLRTALNFEIFGVNIANTVMFILTMLIVLAIIVVFMRLVT